MTRPSKRCAPRPAPPLPLAPLAHASEQAQGLTPPSPLILTTFPSRTGVRSRAQSDFIRNESDWFRIVASAVDSQKQHCAVVALTGKPGASRVRRASVIQRRGSVFDLPAGKDGAASASSASGPGKAASSTPVVVAMVNLASQQVESQVQLAKSFQDPTTINFAAFSQDGKVVAIANNEPENKVIVVDPRSGEMLFTFNSDTQMLDLVFTVEKRFKQSEVYALLVLGTNKLQVSRNTRSPPPASTPLLSLSLSLSTLSVRDVSSPETGRRRVSNDGKMRC